MRHLTALFRGFSAAFGSFFGLVFLWAAIETATRHHLQPASARGSAFYVIAAVSLGVGLFVAWRRVRQRAAGSAAPPGHPRDAMARAADALEALVRNAGSGAAAPRSLTPPERQVLEGAARACIAIRHVFPPRHPPRTLNGLGGLPVAPEGFDYPTMQGTPVGLGFMAQIDLATIPQGWSRAALPAQGHLYFFAPLMTCFDAEFYRNCVRFVPATADASWAPRSVTPPAVLAPFEDAAYTHPWLKWHPRPEEAYPRISPRVEIELGWVEQELAGADAAPPDQAGAPQAAHVRANLLDFHGPALPQDPLLSGYQRPTDRLWLPFEGFPTNRHAAEILLGYVKCHVAGKILLLRKELDGALPPANPADEKRVHELAQCETFAFFLSKQPLAVPTGDAQRAAPLTDEERQQILRVLETVRLGKLPLVIEQKGWPPDDPVRKLNGWIAEAAELSAETALRDPAAAAQIPARYVDALRYWHTPLKQHLFEPNGYYMQHQMFGRGRCVQDAYERWGETHVMLMQFSPDQALGWRLGDNGVLQYWMTPIDLAAGRFERAILTFEGH